MTLANVMTAGRDDVPEEERIDPTITFCKWGMVYSHMADSYHTHYAMIWKQRLWRGRSYGGVSGRLALTTRAIRWAGYVVKEAAEMEGVEVPPSDAELLTQNAQLLLTMRAMVDLVEGWMRSVLKRAGVHFPTVQSYPPALRKARKLIGRSWR
jgi:hypothetical protein